MNLDMVIYYHTKILINLIKNIGLIDFKVYFGFYKIT